MRTLVVVLIFGLIGTACRTVDPTSDPATTGGVRADPVKTPSHILRSTVALRSAGGDCTGVLIHERVVLTAQHCIDGGMYVYFGIAMADAPKIQATATLQHQKLDIALLMLSDPAPAGFAPARLPSKPWEMGKGKLVTLAGYGTWFVKDEMGIWEQIKDSDVMQVVDLAADLSEKDLDSFMVVSQAEGYKFQVDLCKPGAHLCFVTQGAGSQTGDSGGPIYDPTERSLIGVVSRGKVPSFRRPIKFAHRTIEEGKFFGFSEAVAIFPEKNWIRDGIKKLLATNPNP